MAKRHEGKTVVISGAASGIGQASAVRLAEEGAQIIIADRAKADQTLKMIADAGGTAAWTVKGGKLVEVWKNGNGGTSPVVAGGLLYIYDPKGGLRLYEPTNGNQVATLESGSGHWNSPIVVNGKIALPEGNANHPADSGVLDIWSLPAAGMNGGNR